MTPVFIPGAGLYTPHNATDFAAAQDTAALIATKGAEAFTRDPNPGHCCASALVLSHDNSHMLLMHHVKYDAWVQPGGHCDGNTNFLEVARQELEEETGLSHADLMQDSPFHVEIHKVAAWKTIPTHLHYDVRYLFKAPKGATIAANNESHGVAWKPRSDWARFMPTVAHLLPA